MYQFKVTQFYTVVKLICNTKKNSMTSTKNIGSTEPFTVFAPTDAAFAAIQKEVDSLLKPENKTKLASILTYHVVSGKHMAADLKDGSELTTV